MHISRVELENFKSHADSTFEFGRGTTSITGENGAGKTSIIESIAWTLFDTLDYKKEDVVRRGEKKAVVRVTFESGLDEREYTVYRDTGTGYYVFDPRLRTKIADKKEEVTRFLWQHLGIEPGTDLESLFKHAIGVPQGTFTAIFLATAAERKKTFDSLLKVEEYRRSSDELLKTVRYIEQRVTAVDIRIARAEGEITRIDLVEEDVKLLTARVNEEKEALKIVGREVDDKQTRIAELDRMEAKLIELRTEAERRSTELSRVEIILKQRETDLERSRVAATQVNEVKADYDAYQTAAGRLIEIERERGERQKLRDDLGRIETALAAVQADQKHFLSELERIGHARSEIESLSKLTSDQDRLEREVEIKRAELAKAEAAAAQLASLEQRIVALRDAYRKTSDDLKTAREKVAGAAEAASLEIRETTIVRDLATANAALERDERFQKEIRNGLCPILSQKCLNLKEGETLEGFISSQFGELRSQISTLTVEKEKIGDALKSAREAERFVSQISLLEARLAEVQNEGKTVKAQKDEVEKDSANLESFRTDFARVDAELKHLDNPKAKISVHRKDVDREPEFREQLSLSEKNIERLESERRGTVEKLETYKDLDAFYGEASQTRERTANAYRVFIANEAAAGQVTELEELFRTATTEHAGLIEAAATIKRDADAAEKAYDRERHLSERTELSAMQKRQVEATVMLDSSEKRLAELNTEIERLYSVRTSMQDEFRERERLKKIAETTDFIRSTLKEAAPLVARNYVHHVSLEANQLFREIGGDAEVTLKWAEDYGIILEEGGYDRPFQSLSGGEQMAAALSVRLALLKQLSDIHIAFFDEPTTNMDAERRENLAMQIGRITHLDQLFVISHDDTFEEYTDYEVRVGD